MENPKLMLRSFRSTESTYYLRQFKILSYYLTVYYKLVLYV